MNKKSVLKRLLQEGSLKTKTDYIKQYKMLASLIKKFPNENFWSVITFPDKFKSLYYFKTKFGEKLLDKKYKAFNRRISAPKTYNLKEKTGTDKSFSNKPKTIREFLKE